MAATVVPGDATTARDGRATGYGRCAWGLILVFLDFELGWNGRAVDLLPDVVGAVLLLVGLSTLVRRGDQRWEWARLLAWPLLGVATVGLAVALGDSHSDALRFGLAVATGTLGVLVGWPLAFLAADTARDFGNDGLSGSVRHRGTTFALTWVAVLLISVAAGAIDPETPQGLGDAVTRGVVGSALVAVLLAGLLATFFLAGGLFRVARLVAGEDADRRLVSPGFTRGTVALVGIAGLAFVWHAALSETDGGAPPVVEGNGIVYGPTWDWWRVTETGSGQCRFEGRMRLSSGGDDFVVRRNVRGEVWGFAWTTDTHGFLDVHDLARTKIDLGWWWKARGAVVDVVRAIPCDARRIEVTVNADGALFSQTSRLELPSGR